MRLASRLASAKQQVRFARALRSRPFALLWAGQAVSSLGNGAYFTALAWQVLLLTHSATAMGLVVVASSLPMVAFLLVGGVAADRLPRRLLMLWSDGGRAVAVGVIALLGLLGVLQLWHLIALSLAFGIVQGFFSPAYRSYVPQLVEVEALPSANGLTGVSQNFGQLVGPLLGAGCVAIVGPYLAFAVDALTFVVSALCLVAMGRAPASMPPARAPTAETPIQARAETPFETPFEALAETPPTAQPRMRKGIRGVLAELGEGWAYIVGSPWLTTTMLLPAIGNVGLTGSLTVSLPKLIKGVLQQGPFLLGAAGATSAVGAILGLLVVAQLSVRHRGIVAFSILGLGSVALAFFGVPLPLAVEPVVICAASLVFGFSIEAFNTIWLSTVQALVPSEKLGRVFSLDSFVSFGLTPVGFALAGIFTDQIGARWVFVASGLINLALCLLALGIRGVRELE